MKLDASKPLRAEALSEVQRLQRELKKVKMERDIQKNVWSAPNLRVTGLQFRQNNVCVNVSGLFAQFEAAGHDGIRAHQAQ
uniref:hypothetical protein n=1 Tax=Paraburkholderia adhaesiva TaxID=2883244 RepID=UPI001F2F2FD2|nr:hypothetical protein [Paraburkholderia adhaesiva]